MRCFLSKNIIINNEDDAWFWLKKALNDDLEIDQPIRLKFDGWPSIDQHFRGHDFDSSIPTRIMPSMLQAQKEINRIYSQIHYNEKTLRKLTVEDRERLELTVRVKEGSSKYDTNLADTFSELANSAIKNMESKHILTVLISAALIWGSCVSWKAWMTSQQETHAKEIDSKHAITMSSLEKDKMALLAKAQEVYPSIREFTNNANRVRNDSLHQLKPSDSFTTQGLGIDISGDYAAQITEKPRAQSTEHRIDGEFIIQSVISGETKGFKLKVKRVIDGKMITVSIPDGTLSYDQSLVLRNNEWAKKPILMEINAKILRDEVSSATLVSVKNIPELKDQE